MTKGRWLLIACSATMVLAGAACGDDDDDDAAGSALSGTAWFLQADSLDVDFPDGMEDVTMAFTTDGSVAGHAGCNNYTGGYTTSGDSNLTLSQLATTRMMCEDPVMAVEAAYLAELDRVDSFEIDGDELVLRDVDDNDLLSYTRDG
jgi:heat shock protein HslJ